MVRLNDEYRARFDEMIHSCASARMRSPSQRRFTAFWPSVGLAYHPHQSLMVVGRAVNGWLETWVDASMPADEGRQTELREMARSYAQDPERLAWVGDERSKWQTGYNPRRSQFWAVVKLLTDREGSSALWHDQLAWSNLYKLAPADGGNPGTALCNAQFEYATDLLEREVMAFAPRHIVFLTGWHWACDFLEAEGSVERTGAFDLVEAAGRWRGVPVAVGPHPQGKAIRRVADAVTRTLESLEVGT